MPFADYLEDKNPTPPSKTYVLVVAAMVALVIGCLPALGTALIVNSDLSRDSKARDAQSDKDSTLRSYQNCVTVRDGRILGNERNRLNKINLKADVDLFQYVIELQRTPDPDQKLTERQLERRREFTKRLQHLVNVKQNQILPLTKRVPVPDCERDFPVPKADQQTPEKAK